MSPPRPVRLVLVWAVVALTVYAWGRACTLHGFPWWVTAAGGLAIGVAGAQWHNTSTRPGGQVEDPK